MYCEKCGNELKEEVEFCSKCGNKVGEDTVSTEHHKNSKNKKSILVFIVILAIAIATTVFITCHWDKVKKLVTGVEIERQEESVDKKYTQEEIDNMIGKYVDYKPTYGTYIAKAEMTGVANSPEGVKGDQKFQTEDMKWRIWNIDDSNIMLISDEPTSHSGEEEKCINLYGKNAYENGIAILDELCKTCYTNLEYKGIQARSLNLQDIESVINEREFNTKEYQKNITKEIEAKLADEPLKVENIKINAWCFNNEMSATTMESSYYRKPVYAEMIHGGRMPYYLATKMEVSCLATIKSKKGNLESLGLYGVGSNILTEMDEKIIAPGGLYIKFDGQEDEEVGIGGVRPIVVIPLSSCEIVNDTEGTREDMWRIIAK